MNDNEKKLTEEAQAKRREYQRAYRLKHKDRLNALRREWNKKNPDKAKKYAANYWNRKAEAEQGGLKNAV